MKKSVEHSVISRIQNLQVGETPLLYLEKYGVYAKFEKNNPTGSVKDRPVYFMVLQAVKDGLIGANTTIVEPTSGNTGIALAWIGAKLGLRVILTMPESVSVERRHILKSYGADIILTENMTKAVEKAKEISNNINVFIPNQFDNPNNVKAHLVTTGPEILRQMKYNVDAFVAGVGTGGTITGVGHVLKTFDTSSKVIAVEPKQSAVLSGQTPGKHRIQGIGAGFVPGIFDKSVVDEILQVDDEEALKFTQRLWKEGIFVGISAAANLIGALMVKEKYNLERVVTVFPDDGMKYLSVLSQH
ncbi:MAG: cysteine synthase family protein [Fervidobacterium sp.]|uniref:cysteine synthase n=1 Tax=Fervidobacterium gondwanense DSM 13020 TaxID=1121883 RepID=A0A1M7SZI1_FERGO|nr:cysteine synthase family protein [Fervidobacterium gondwanense]SHN63923.1 cysteine synthase A [Fervidobacterium gondwanense DSM 13020]